MKRVFLDTNILMDYIDNREHGPEAAFLLDTLPIMTAAEFLQSLLEE